MIHKGGCEWSNLYFFTIEPLQKKILQSLREKVVLVHKTFTDETKRINKIFSFQHTSCCHSNYYSNSANLNFSTRRFKLSSSSDLTPPLDLFNILVEKDGKIYPKNPTNDYICAFPVNLFGCVSCESNTHIFKDCDNQGALEVHSIY